MKVVSNAIAFGLWLMHQSLRNDGFDLKGAAERGLALDLPEILYDGGKARSTITIHEVLEKAYKAQRIGTTDESGDFAIIHDGTDNCIHTMGWWTVLEAINLQPDRLKPWPLPEEPDQRLEVLRKNIEMLNDGAKFDMSTVLATLNELGVPNQLDCWTIMPSEAPRVGKLLLESCVDVLANDHTAQLVRSKLEFIAPRCVFSVEKLPPELVKIGRAFITRRDRLYVRGGRPATVPD